MSNTSVRYTEKQRHTNRKNLHTRIKNHDGDSFLLNESIEEVANKYGQVLSKGGVYIIVLKAKIYKLEEIDCKTKVNTTALERTDIALT